MLILKRSNDAQGLKPMKTASGLYKTGLPTISGLPLLTVMASCLLVLSGASVNAQQKMAEVPVYNTQIPVYVAPPAHHSSHQPLVRQKGSSWAHPALPVQTSYSVKKNRGSAFKPKERKPAYSAGPGFFADTCNSQKEITDPKLIKICAPYKNRPAPTTTNIPSRPIK